MPDLMQVLANFSSQIPPIIMMLQSIALLMGVSFTASALIEFWGIDNANAMKVLPGGDRFTVVGGLVKLLIGAMLASMSTLELVGVMSRTLTEDYANSRFMSYSPASGTFEEQRLAAMAGLLGIMQIVGFVAMCKGWLTFNNIANRRTQAGPGQAWAWLIGGVIAWNFKWFTDVLNCSMGFNVIGIFAPFAISNACGP